VTSKVYTGIGSRRTPKVILDFIFLIAQELGKQGYILRSGGANGADTFFERGCDSINGQKEIYLPEKGFNGNGSELYIIPNKAYRIAKEYHPYYYKMKQYTKNLMARNIQQVLGQILKDPTDFILCWTPDGAGAHDKPPSSRTGGTGQAIRVALDYNIPVHNLADERTLKYWQLWYNETIEWRKANVR
jgi:hypothetical protein